MCYISPPTGLQQTWQLQLFMTAVLTHQCTAALPHGARRLTEVAQDDECLKTTSGFWQNHRFKVCRVLVPIFLPYVWLFFMGTGQPSQASAEHDYLNGHGRRSACSTGAAGGAAICSHSPARCFKGFVNKANSSKRLGGEGQNVRSCQLPRRFQAPKYYLLVHRWCVSRTWSCAALAAVGLAGMNESTICCACGDDPSCIILNPSQSSLCNHWLSGGGWGGWCFI